MNASDVNQPSHGVCAECFADESIKAFVREHAVWNECPFCKGHSSAPIAAPIDDVTDFVHEGLESCWTTDPDEAERDDEGRLLSPSYETDELLRLDWMAPWPIPPICNEAVIVEISRRLGPDTWYYRPATREIPYGKLVFDWGDFCECIKHKSRFFLSAPLEGDFEAFEPQYFPTDKILYELGAWSEPGSS